MLPSRKFTRALGALSGIIPLLMVASSVMAADPGVPYPASSAVSDQHPGSILFFNLYTSNAVMPNLQNTRFSITNTSTTSSAIVHMFFIDGATCSPSNVFTCLTPNQTTSFLAAEQAPNETGFMIAIAVDQTGCPVAYNFLIGSAFIKTQSGHEAALQAESVSALYNGTAPGCNGSTSTLTLLFNGDTSGTQVSYDRLPRVIAASKIPAVADGNDTRIVVNRIGGSLLTGLTPIGNLFGFVFDDTEDPHSFTVQNVACQLFRRVDNAFPHTTPNVETYINSGHTGWLKLWQPVQDAGLLGSVLNRNTNLTSAPDAFVGGHNMHKLTLAETNSLVVPVFPGSCL